MNKEGFTFAQFGAFLLVVVVIVVIVAGGIPRFTKLFGETDKPIDFITQGRERLDFSFLTGEQKGELAKQNPEAYMSRLLEDAGKKFRDGIYRGVDGALALYKKYLGICNSDVAYKDASLKESEFKELGKFCQSKVTIEERITTINALVIDALKKEIGDKLTSQNLGNVQNLIDELVELDAVGSADFLKTAKETLDKLAGEVKESIDKLSLTVEACKNSASIVDAWICEGDGLLDKIPKDVSGAKSAYLKAINAARQTREDDSDDLKSYFALGKVLEIEDKARAYNLYEDLLILYEKDFSGTQEYQRIISKINIISSDDNEFYVANVKFSKVSYRFDLHAGIDESSLGGDEFEWTPTKDGSIGYQSGKAVVEGFVTFNPAQDYEDNKEDYQDTNPYNPTGDPPTLKHFECIEPAAFEFNPKWGDQRAVKKKGFEAQITLRDSRNNVVCRDVWFTNGKSLSNLKRANPIPLCSERSSNNFGVKVDSFDENCSDFNINFLKFKVTMGSDDPADLAKYLQ